MNAKQMLDGKTKEDEIDRKFIMKNNIGLFNYSPALVHVELAMILLI